MMDQIVYWVRKDPSGLGRPWLPGAPASESMAVPMMLLNLVEQLGEADDELAGKYADLGDWCAQRILQHVQVRAGGWRQLPDRTWVLESRAPPLLRAAPPPAPTPTWTLVVPFKIGRLSPGPLGRWRAQGAGWSQGQEEGFQSLRPIREQETQPDPSSSRLLWAAQPTQSRCLQCPTIVTLGGPIQTLGSELVPLKMAL